MDIKDWQKKADEIINKIDNKCGCSHDINNTFIHLIEELGEVARELNKPNIRNENINREELGKEIADVLFFIARVANLNNIDIEEAINGKLKELNARHGFK